MTFKSGQKVTTAASWRKRRSEILEDFEREVYGRRPQRIPSVSWQVVKTTTASDGGVETVAKQLLGRVDNSAYPAITVNIQAILTLPANARGRVPVIIQFGGGGFELPAGVSASTNLCQVPGAASGAGPAPAAARWSGRARRRDGGTDVAAADPGARVGLREPERRQRSG